MYRVGHLKGAKAFVEGHSHPFATPQGETQENKYLGFLLLHPADLLLVLPLQQTQL